MVNVFFHFPVHNVIVTEKNTKYMCIDLYNSLPENKLDMDDFRKFKKNLISI